MLVEIWSDIVCPFCYIGKRQFEKALAGFEHRADVQLVYRSFELNPDMPKTFVGNLHEYLAKHKGVGVAAAKKMNDGVSAYAAEVGLHYDMEHAQPANSFDAHRLVHLAAKHNLADAMIEKLHSAYFVEGKNIGNKDDLIQLAKLVGLNQEEVARALDTDQFAKEVRGDEQEARKLGIESVPFFAFDRKLAVVGAQDSTAFLQALREAEKNK